MHTLTTAPATANLPRGLMDELITSAQDVPMTVWFDEDGQERQTYGSTASADDALAHLATSFLPLMRKVVRTFAGRMDVDDAMGVVQMEFVAAVRRHDVLADRPFHSSIETILTRAVSDVARSQRGIVSVPESTSARFYQLIHKHDGDVEAAYRECCTTTNGFEPHTFLAVHAALASSDVSLDGLLPGGSGEQDHTPSPLLVAAPHNDVEDFLSADLVRWLFTLVPERQERILRLLFGFTDLATETLRCAFGFHPGAVMSDKEVSGVVGDSVATVSRHKREALATMRAGLLESMRDEA